MNEDLIERIEKLEARVSALEERCGGPEAQDRRVRCAESRKEAAPSASAPS